MPELPEVETIAQDLIEAQLIGRTVQEARVLWPRTVACPSVDLFQKRLKGKRFLAVGRRGKFLKFTLSGEETILVHLRMTGRLQLLPAPNAPLPHERLALLLEDGYALVYRDPRKFGRWYLVKDPEEILGKLGLEPLSPEFSISLFTKLLAKKSRQLKALLLDQTSIAGLGNIYVDEALWLARLHPLTRSNHLNPKEIAALHAAIQHVLQRGLKAAGTTLGSGQSNFYRLSGKRGSHQEQLLVFRRTGQSCPRCHTPIQRLIVASRSSHICPQCQKQDLEEFREKYASKNSAK